MLILSGRGAGSADVAVLNFHEFEEGILFFQMLFQFQIVLRLCQPVGLAADHDDFFEILQPLPRVQRRRLLAAIILFIEFRPIIVHLEFPRAIHLKEMEEALRGGAGGRVAGVVLQSLLTHKLSITIKQRHHELLTYLGDGKNIRKQVVELDFGAHFRPEIPEILLRQFAGLKCQQYFYLHMIKIRHRTQRHKHLHMLPVKLRVRHHRNEHLRRALAMADVRNPVLPGHLHDLLPECWLIKQSHLMEAVIEKLLPLSFDIRIDPLLLMIRILDIQKGMLLRIFISSSVVEPDVEAGLDESDADRVLIINNIPNHRILPAMLANHDRFLFNI